MVIWLSLQYKVYRGDDETFHHVHTIDLLSTVSILDFERLCQIDQSFIVPAFELVTQELILCILSDSTVIICPILWD